ncbi:MAG: T9SS type A sorting domain-containing protein [Bacteroidales bacterium]|nr:T9SS type A sorting domain-containing protein [Bacteroidales bacterium]
MKKIYLFAILAFVCSTSFSQWIEQATGFSTASRGIKYISAVDENVVWATAYDGTTTTNYITEFTRTTNGGATWTAGTVTGYTSGYGSAMIFGLDANTAWMPVFNTSAGGGKILKTTDGGTTWTAQTTAAFAAPAGFPNVIHFWDANNGWCQGDPNGGYFEFYTTTDGGENWTRVPQANIPDPIAADEYGVTGFYSVVGDNVWFSTNKGRVFKSTDKGYTWSVYTTTLTNQFTISFKDANYGLAYQIDNYTIAKSTDGGETWTVFTPAGNLYSSDLAYVPGTPNTWVSTGNESGASFSLFGGDYWEDFSSFPGQMLTTAWVNNTCGWVGNFNTDASTGGIYKFDGVITDPYDNDVAAITISNPVDGLPLTASENISVSIMNMGLNAQTGFDVTYILNGGTPVTETFSGTLNPGETIDYNFTATEDFSAAGIYEIEVYTSLTGDENSSNDGFTMDVVLMNTVPVKRVLHEQFTANWCVPCASANPIFDALITHNSADFISGNHANATVIKHQVFGDAYENADCQTRLDYYGDISGIPDLKVEGANDYHPANYTQALFNDYKSIVPYFDIQAQHSFAGDVITVDVTINPFYNLNGTVRVAVIEGTTTGNVGTNGETEFFHVLMKYLPDANGTNANFVVGTPWTQSFSYDMNTTFYEETGGTDLNVVVFIQDDVNKLVHNSAYSTLSVSSDNLINEKLVKIFPNPSNGLVNVSNAENTKISVYNLLGECVYISTIENSFQSIDLGNQAKGSYLIRLEGNDNAVTKIIVIE